MQWEAATTDNLERLIARADKYPQLKTQMQGHPEVEPLFMRAGQSQLTECRAVGTQLVGYEQFRREPLFLEQLAH
jgi:hypothetical protein